MVSGLTRTTRSGRSYIEIIAEDDPNDIAVLQLDFSIDMDDLARQSIEDSENPDLEEPQTFTSIPNTLKRKYDSEDSNPAPQKTPRNGKSSGQKAQSANNSRRAKRRAEKQATLGHPRGTGRAFERHVMAAEPIQTALVSEELPIAEGGWVATDCSYVGAKVKRKLETLKAQGFVHIPWKGRCVMFL
ncbi:hypothetical protein FB446DRAFT_105217 [Lentinula raphanica]|nr:hypothetical protein FB446DRAFT_105217 [Lentinula raphanica]